MNWIDEPLTFEPLISMRGLSVLAGRDSIVLGASAGKNRKVFRRGAEISALTWEPR
jgi:hypothetical protein